MATSASRTVVSGPDSTTNFCQSSRAPRDQRNTESVVGTALYYRDPTRSEERRVGKECRSLCDWSSDVCSSYLGTGLHHEFLPEFASAARPAEHRERRRHRAILP